MNTQTAKATLYAHSQPEPVVPEGEPPSEPPPIEPERPVPVPPDQPGPFPKKAPPPSRTPPLGDPSPGGLPTHT